MVNFVCTAQYITVHAIKCDLTGVGVEKKLDVVVTTRETEMFYGERIESFMNGGIPRFLRGGNKFIKGKFGVIGIKPVYIDQ